MNVNPAATHAVLNEDWMRAEKVTDPDFEDSLSEQLGFDAQLCPTCHAHLWKGICLNACHLSDDMRERFYAKLQTYIQLPTTPASDTDSG